MTDLVEFPEGDGIGDQVLTGLRAAIQRYTVLPSEDHAVAVTLWVAATHCVPAFEYATRLAVRSAEKRSGKSRLLEVIDATCHKPLRAVNATVPAIFRSLDGDNPPTLILDEADTIFGSKKVAEQNEDLRGLLNAGFQRGLPVLRVEGSKHEPKEFPTFAMAALAGIGALPDTIEDRAVIVKMQRRKPSEKVQPYRIRRDAPALHAIRDDLAFWAATIIPRLEGYYPDMPLEDRAADTWEPLIAVADMAEGSWPDAARNAAVSLTSEAADDSEADSINLRLLADIKSIFDGTDETPCAPKASFIPSSEMCQRLGRIEESPWADWEFTPSKLGHRLKDYGIKTSRNTFGNARGYRLEDFTDTFERYLRQKPSEGGNGAETQGKPSDTFGASDTLKASDQIKASDQEPQNNAANHLLTPSDGYTAEDMGKVVGVHPVYGEVTALRNAEGSIVLTPIDQTLKGVWYRDDRPDLAPDLEGAAA